MNRWVLVGAVVLTGCVSFKQMDNNLSLLVGQDKSVAFKALGYPDHEQTFDNTKVYSWVTTSAGAEPYTAPQTTFGTVGGKPFQATTTQTAFVPVNYTCKIQISADAKGIIKDYKYSSSDPSVGACMEYIRGLNNFFKR